MRKMFLTPLTPLLELNFTLNKLLIFFRPIVGAFALGTIQFN